MHPKSTVESFGDVFNRDLVVQRNIIPNIEIDRLDCPALILQRGAQWLEIQSRGRVTVN